MPRDKHWWANQLLQPKGKVHDVKMLSASCVCAPCTYAQHATCFVGDTPSYLGFSDASRLQVLLWADKVFRCSEYLGR